jgi:Na+/melibiose symporter-like transporter
VLSPVVSYRSDRLRSRLGRRIPFLLFSTPIAVVAMLGLAASPVIAHWLRELLGPRAPSPVLCVIWTFGFFWTMFEVAAIICNALHGALVNDVVPRPVLGRFFGLFRVVSLGAGILFNYYFLKHVAAHYVAMFVGLAVLYGVAFSAMCLNVREGEYPPPPPAPAGDWLTRVMAGIAMYFRECFSIPLYLWFFVSFFFAHVAFAPINLFSLYYAQSVGMTMATYGKFSALQLLCSMIQAPILGWLCDKFHPLRMTIIALGMYAITTLLAFGLVRDWRMFAAAHVICGTCSGIWLTTTAPLAQVLLPKMKFATFASALAIFIAAATMTAGPVVGRFLDFINRRALPGARDYHYIYLWASFFISLSLVSTLVVYRHVALHGGLRNYHPPEREDELI